MGALDSLTNARGTPLDREWMDAISTTSDTGTAGGQFNFRIDVLAGDVNNSVAVNVSGHLLNVFGQNGAVPATLGEAYFDINSIGAVNVSGDLLDAFSLNGATLPIIPPDPPDAPQEKSLTGKMHPGLEEENVDHLMGPSRFVVGDESNFGRYLEIVRHRMSLIRDRRATAER